MKKDILFFVILISLLFFFFYSTFSNISYLEKEVRHEVDSVKKFYFYNHTDDGLFRNKSELIKFGGDCETWALYYNSIFSEKYYTSLLVFPFDEYKNHAVLSVSDGSEYCIINQVYYDCYQIE